VRLLRIRGTGLDDIEAGAQVRDAQELLVELPRRAPNGLDLAKFECVHQPAPPGSGTTPAMAV
jgi:hypothetical protein